MKNKENNRPEYTEAGNADIGNAPKIEKLLDRMFKINNNSEERSQKLEKIRLIKKYFGWSNKDIARLLNSTPNNIKSRLSPSAKQNLPVWVDAFIVMFETLKPDTLDRIKNLEERFQEFKKQGTPDLIIIDESQFIK
jgi:hypothetical protein